MPTGNFGNVLAGWIARRMGLPIDQLVIGSNRNDILTRFLPRGDMATRVVVPTLSPSMDIQVASNFERLLFELNDRDGGMTAEQLQRFRADGHARRRARPARPARAMFAGARVRRRRDARRSSPAPTRDTGMLHRPAHRGRRCGAARAALDATRRCRW